MKKLLSILLTLLLLASCESQEEYLNDILNYVCQNGDITRETMAEEPFSSFSWQPVFNTRLTALVHYVNKIHEVIVAL